MIPEGERGRPLERTREEARVKILIVDDSSIMRKIVVRTLKQAGFTGHTIEEAENGKDALSKIEADAPDLVLTDWNMPEMTGIELVKAMAEKKLSIPFAFITSECTTEMKNQANAAGAVAFLTKPFTAETMQSVLAKILD
jgi:two-component system chemotaxis response regulator CheY